jgi:hypothetical protein
MKPQWLMIALLLVPSSLIAQARYTEQQVVNYGKALDVAKLDPTLSSQRLDEWLRSGPAHLYKITWEMSDCDLMGSDDPKYVAPLCVKVRLARGDAGGWVLITIGTFRDGIKGTPHVDQIFLGSDNGDEPISNKLSDLPRLLDGIVVSPATGSHLPGHEGTKFNRVSVTNGMSNSGASWDETFYRTATGATVGFTIVHLNSRESAKNEYADWLNLKGVRIISKGEVQDKTAAKPATAEDRAVVKMAVPSECDEGTAILATAGNVLHVIQSCSAKAAFEFEKEAQHGENQNGQEQ